MLEEMVKKVIDKTLETSYPHLELPAVVYATIASVKKLPETFDVEELVIHNDEGGGSYRGHISAYWYEYVLNIVDRFGSPDEAFPALPGVKSKMQFRVGAVVAVALPYGDLTPVIIGEVPQ